MKVEFDKKVNYLIVGSFSTLISIMILPTINFLTNNIKLIYQITAATILNVTISFCLQRFFVFKSNKKIFIEYIKFWFSSFFVLVFCNSILFFLIEEFLINVFISNLVVTILSALLGFIIHTRFTFSERH